MMSDLIKQLATIQQTLNAPKSQWNSFGKYNYRNCEDILQAVKPLLGDAVITINDDIQLVADRVYVKATVTISLNGESHSVSAFAREALVKKGMDDAMCTGATSSYARKYALNGLLLIDDNKDPDHSPEQVKDKLAACTNMAQLNEAYKGLNDGDKIKFKDQFTDKKADLQNLQKGEDNE